MQTPIQGDLARVWRYWRQIWMDPRIWTHSCCQLGIQFPHCISHQAQSSPIVLIMLLHLSPASMHSQWRFFFINFLVYSIRLFLLTLSFHALFGVSSQTSFHFNSCFSYSHIYFTENKILIKSLLKKDNQNTNKRQMTESSPPDFPQSHPRTPLHHLCSSPFWLLLLNPISAPL